VIALLIVERSFMIGWSHVQGPLVNRVEPSSGDKNHAQAVTEPSPNREGRPRRFLLLSAYRADSHRRWADGLVARYPAFDWRRLELPGRHFAWRIRGNPLSWLYAFDAAVPDAIVATSMVDLATIRGLNPRFGRVPTLLYFHENQFAYPRSEGQTTSIDAQMVQLYAALAADRVAFNSEYNRASFLGGVDALMQRMPDCVPDGLAERIEARSELLPVPVDAVAPVTSRDPRLIVWNHRWEYDKDPDLFTEAMIRLAERGVSFRLAFWVRAGRARLLRWRGCARCSTPGSTSMPRPIGPATRRCSAARPSSSARPGTSSRGWRYSRRSAPAASRSCPTHCAIRSSSQRGTGIRPATSRR